MDLEIRIDDEQLRECAAKGRSAILEVFWRVDEICYPCEHWSDFGAVILGWWLVEVTSLLETGNRAVLSFMEGPYALQVERSGDKLVVRPSETDYVWESDLTGFLDEISREARRVTNRLARLAISEVERAGLERGVERLEHARQRAHL